MPWCAECGAEYREGVTTCAKCQLPLQREPPPRPEDPAATVREVAAGLLEAAGRQVAESASHAIAGWRLLRRHRALLLVPLLLGLLHGYQEGLYRLAWERTWPDSRQFSRESGLTPLEVARRFWLGRPWVALLIPDTAVATTEFLAPVPWLNLANTSGVIEISAYRETRPDDEERVVIPANWPVSIGLYLLGLAVGSLILGGFYGTARNVVERDVFSWSDFERDGFRYWLRFLVLGCVVGVLCDWLPRMHMWLGRSFLDMPDAYWVGRAYGLPVVAFFLALAWCAIVSEDAGVWTALGRSVVTVARSAVIAVCLLLLLSLARLLLLRPVELADWLLTAMYFMFPNNFLLVPTLMILRPLASALLGVWFCLTALHWYRGARAKIATNCGG